MRSWVSLLGRGPLEGQRLLVEKALHRLAVRRGLEAQRLRVRLVLQRTLPRTGVERNALVVAAAMSVAALFVPPRPDVALSVVAGAVLVGFSYWSLKRSVTALAEMLSRSGARRRERPSIPRRTPVRRAPRAFEHRELTSSTARPH